MVDIPIELSQEIYYSYDQDRVLVSNYNEKRMNWWNQSSSPDCTKNEMIFLAKEVFDFLCVNGDSLAEIAKNNPKFDLFQVSFESSLSAALNSLTNFITDVNIGPVPASEFLYDVYQWVSYVNQNE